MACEESRKQGSAAAPGGPGEPYFPTKCNWGVLGRLGPRLPSITVRINLEMNYRHTRTHTGTYTQVYMLTKGSGIYKTLGGRSVSKRKASQRRTRDH